MDTELLPEDAPKPLLQFHRQDNGPMFSGKRISRKEVFLTKVHPYQELFYVLQKSNFGKISTE